MTTMTLKEKEAEVERLQAEIKKEKQAKCKHEWSDWLPYHNDEFRICEKCKLIEDR